jgi:hypothetical protein
MSNYKPWMRHLRAFRFSRDGLMAQETARDQRLANTRDATCVIVSTHPSWRAVKDADKIRCNGFVLYGDLHS